HVAAHHARELARDAKAKARAAEALSSRGIGLAELLEQLGLLLRRHADAGVGDGELDEAAAIAHLVCRKLDLALLGELAGIPQEIEQIKTCRARAAAGPAARPAAGRAPPTPASNK